MSEPDDAVNRRQENKIMVWLPGSRVGEVSPVQETAKNMLYDLQTSKPFFFPRGVREDLGRSIRPEGGLFIWDEIEDLCFSAPELLLFSGQSMLTSRQSAVVFLMTLYGGMLSQQNSFELLTC